ncbi:hypothetical protein FRB99_000372 [Tulasnella sp. 403]|nr:hypothetical protein FRB99_000372 [Tulasnella sp. 403]
MSGSLHPQVSTYNTASSSRSSSRDPMYDVDYDHESHAYPPKMQQNSTYSSSDHTSAAQDDDQRHAEPLYPPFRIPMSQSPYGAAPTDIRPSLSTDFSIDSPSTKGQFASNVDLETLSTDEGTDRPIHSQVEIQPTTGIETGWKAAFWPNSKACRAYILAVVIEAIVGVGIEGAILQQLDKMQESVPQGTATLHSITQTRQPVYLGLFALAHVLQMVLAVDAVYNKNTLQFLFLASFNLMLMIYGAMQIVEVQLNINDLVNYGATSPSIPIHVLTILVPITIAIAEVAYITFGYQIWKEFGWKVYKFLGADRTIKKIYASYQVFQCLLKFNIFTWVGFSIQWISLVLVDKSDFEYYATIVALPLSILLLLEGFLAARHENKWMMWSFMIGCFAGFAYFTYKGVITVNKRAKEQKLERRATEYKKSGPNGPAGRYGPSLSTKRMSIE